MNAGQLSDLLHCAKRTIHRDIRLLRLADVPISYDDGRQGYRIPSSNTRIPLHLPDLALVVSVTRALSGIPCIGKELVSAAGHISRAFPCEVSSIADRVILDITPDGLQHSPHFTRLFQAICTGHKIRIHYKHEQGIPESTLLSPYILHYRGQEWRVLGRSSCARQVVGLRLDDIFKVENVPDIFEVPSNKRIHAHMKRVFNDLT